jgi:hypothetical protein
LPKLAFRNSEWEKSYVNAFLCIFGRFKRANS